MGFLTHLPLDGSLIKNLPASAGDTGFDPRSGKIPRATELLSL